jgi:ATP-dependent Clp protease ATP-binding subunit ClpX
MAITREGRICSFCGTAGGPGTDVPLIGGLGAQICQTCVDDFHAILHDDELRVAAKGATPWDRMTDAEVLATLPQIMASAEQNSAFAQEWVDLLRARKVSWAEIGRSLGVSRQAAWERFARKTGDKSATA